MVSPPSPSPASAEVSCHGANKLEKQIVRWFLMICMKKVKKNPARGLKKWSPRKRSPPFTRGGSKNGNPTMTSSTATAKRKGDPQHDVEGKIYVCIKRWSKVVNIYFQICSYIQVCILDPIATLKILICNTKKNKNTKYHFQKCISINGSFSPK